MSTFISKFNTILISVILILLGIDIVVAYYGLLPIQLIIPLNLVAIGFLILLRGLKERTLDERKFYFLWSSIVFITALSISLSYLAELVIGLAMLFVGLGIVILCIAMHFSS